MTSTCQRACGQPAEAIHESDAQCIEALKARISRLVARDVLDRSFGRKVVKWVKRGFTVKLLSHDVWMFEREDMRISMPASDVLHHAVPAPMPKEEASG